MPLLRHYNDRQALIQQLLLHFTDDVSGRASLVCFVPADSGAAGSRTGICRVRAMRTCGR